MSVVAVRPGSLDDRSEAIILSIDSKWSVPLLSGSLQCVIRKRLPISSYPRFVYFHAKSPLSAIIGRAEIVEIRRAPLAFLLHSQVALQIDAERIESYVGNSTEAGWLKFRAMEATKRTVGLARLRSELEYFPPQSFAFVSRKSLPIIDEMCGF